MKTVAGIVFAILCAGSFVHADEPTRPALFLQAITLDAQDGRELDRKNVSGPYESVDDCSAAQRATGTQHVERARGLPGSSGMLQVTVFMCAALRDGKTT